MAPSRVFPREDEGKGMDEEHLRKVRRALFEHTPESGVVYGLYNVNERIRLNYGEGYGIHIESILNRGTRVELRLPKSKKQTEIVEK